MARKGGRGRGGRGGGGGNDSFDSNGASPARGRKGRGGKAARGHMGFSTGAFGVLGDDSLNNSDAGAQEVDQGDKGKVPQMREEHVDVHMEGGGDAEFCSDMSRVHIQGTAGSPMHITVGSREHLGQRYKEHHISMLEGDQGALRSMHCDDKMMHHRLSKMSINSNADEFIFVGGRPPDSSHSQEAARGSHQQLLTPEIQVNGEPILAEGGRSRIRSCSVSHQDGELLGMPTARSRSQFNITGAPSIHIQRETTGGSGITSFAADGHEILIPASGDVEIPSVRGSSSHIVIGNGVGPTRSRAVSHASIHSHASHGEIHIPSHSYVRGSVEFAAGDRQSRPVSRASSRSVVHDPPRHNMGDFDDKRYRSRSVSRASLRSHVSNFGNEVILEDDLDDLAEQYCERSRTASLSTDLDVSRVPVAPQLGVEPSFDYGTVFNANDDGTAASVDDQCRYGIQSSAREDSNSIGLNTAFHASDVRPGSRAASANPNDSVFAQRGSSVTSRSLSRTSMNLDDEDEIEHRFDASTRDKSHSRIDLRPEADDLYDEQEDVCLEPFMAKGLPSHLSSRSSSHVSLRSTDEQRPISGLSRFTRASGADSREENLYEADGRRSRMGMYREDAPVLPSPVPSKHINSDDSSNDERQSSYIAGAYHDVGDCPVVPSGWLSNSNVAVGGGDYELTTHFEQPLRNSRSNLSHASVAATRTTSNNSQQPASYRSSGIPSTTEMSSYSISETQLGSGANNESDLRAPSQSSLRSYTKDESVFGSEVAVDRLKEPASEKSQSAIRAGDADVVYHSVSRSRSDSQHSSHSNKVGEQTQPTQSSGHESYTHAPEANRPTSRVSLLSNQQPSRDPTRISMNADKSDVVSFESKSGLWFHWNKSGEQPASKPPIPASDKFRHHSISAKSMNADTRPQSEKPVVSVQKKQPHERQSRPLSRVSAVPNVSSAHVFPILKLPQRARSVSTNSEKTNVGFTEMPELYSHPDERFGTDSPAGVKFRPTIEHQKTPPVRSRSSSVRIPNNQSQEMIPPRPAPRTSITSIPDEANKEKVVSVAQPIKPSAAPTPLHFMDATTPRVDRHSVIDPNEPPSSHTITEIKISRTSTLPKDTVPQNSAVSLVGPSFLTPVRPTGFSFAPVRPQSPISSLTKPSFNNSFETRGHPAVTALNVMFSNRVAAKESLSNVSEQQPEPFPQQKPNRWTKMPSKWDTPEKTDYNSNKVPVNRNASSAYPPQKPLTSDELKRIALTESKLPSTPKTSRGPVFRREDRLSTKSKAEITHTTEVACYVNNPYAQANERRHEPLRTLPNPTWIVQKSPVKPREPEDQWKPAAGDYARQQPNLRIVVQPQEPAPWKPSEYGQRSVDRREKMAHSTWNAPPTPPPVNPLNEPRKTVVHASWSKINKKPGDTVRQNVRPGQIRNLASMFDNIQAKATEEDLVLRGNSLRSSICSRRTRRNSEPNESIREDPEEEDLISKSKDDSFIDARHSVRGRYKRNVNYAVGSGDGDDYVSHEKDPYWQFENAGLQHALSDYDETDDAFRTRVTVQRNTNVRKDRFEEETYYHAASMLSDPDYDDSLPNPAGSVKALAASFEVPNMSSPSEQRRNVSQISKVSENMRTAREISHHDGSSTGRMSQHGNSFCSNRFNAHPEEHAYAQVNKNPRMDDRYAEIRKPRSTSVKEDDYSVIPDSPRLQKKNESRSVISMKNEEDYGRYEDERKQEGDYGSHVRGRRVSSRYDEDKSVGGHIDNLFGFVDDHLGSEKLMSSREYLDSDHEQQMRPSKPLTYSMSGYRAFQRSNRRTTSSVTREDIIAAHQRNLPTSQQGTINSRATARFSPTTAPHVAELSQAGRGVYGKANNSGASGKRYVVGSALATSTPQQSPRGTVALNYSNQQHSRMEDTSFVSSITDSSRIEVDYRYQITRLQHLVKTNSNQIVLTQKALNQARKESKQVQEMNAQKMLLILKERVNLLNREIKRLTALSTVRRPPPPQSRDVKGSLTISNVAIQLNRSFYTRTYELNCTYTFLVLFKCGTEVEAMAPMTLLANHQNRLRSVHFTEKVNFSNLPVDFCVLLEVYVLALSESKNEDQSCATVFANKCRNLLPRDRKPTTSPSGFPIGEFQRCGYIQLTRETTTSIKFYLDETEYPLDGTIDITSHCTTLPPSIEVDYRGFLTMYQNVGGIGSWERYWAVLRRGTIFFWNYPDDESMSKQPKARLDLSTCTQDHVLPCTPELCPRPNTFSVNVLVSTAPSVMDKKRLFLSADSAEMMTAWLEAVNETLSIIRG